MDNKQDHPFVSGKEEGELTANNSSIVIKGARTLSLFFKCILNKT